METLKTGIFAFVIVAFVYVALEKRAHSEPLHHEVQVVTGGAVDARAFADTVRSDLSTFIGGMIRVYVTVTPHLGVATVAVTVIAPRLSPRNIGLARLAIEAVPRVPGVVRNGYAKVRQRVTVATSFTRL